MAQSKKGTGVPKFEEFSTGSITRGTSAKQLALMIETNACTVADASEYARFMIAKSDPSTSKGFIARWTAIMSDLGEGRMDHHADLKAYFGKAKSKAKPKAKAKGQSALANLDDKVVIALLKKMIAKGNA